MVKVRWKLERKKIYLEVDPNNNLLYYYWFPKIGNKKFHPRQLFTRRIDWKAYKDKLIPHITSSEGWIEGELGEDVLDKLGIFMRNCRKLVRVRIEVGKPKRKSGVYVKVLHWGYHGATRQREGGMVVDLKIFQQFQIEEGPGIFDGLDFKLIPYETTNK